MPSWETFEHHILKRHPVQPSTGTAASNIPGFAATSTAGVSLGVSPAGHVTRLNTTGHDFKNLATGEKSFIPVCPLVNRFELTELFHQLPGLNANRDVPAGNTYNTAQMQLGIDKNPNFEVLGTNATSATVAFADGGGITLTTTTGSADQVLILPHLNTAASAWAAAKWNTRDHLVYETVIKTSATLTSQKIFAGFKLTNTPLTATDDDQFYVMYDTGNTNSVSATNWQVLTSRAGTDTMKDSGITVVASTSYHILLVVDQNRIPYTYINGVLVGVGNGTATTGVTTSAGALTDDIDLIPYFGIHTLTAGARAMTSRGLRCSKAYND